MNFTDHANSRARVKPPNFKAQALIYPSLVVDQKLYTLKKYFAFTGIYLQFLAWNTQKLQRFAALAFDSNKIFVIYLLSYMNLQMGWCFYLD